MARNLPKFENKKLIKDFVIPYVPIMPTIQVIYFIRFYE